MLLHTFRVTISPKDGLTKECRQAVIAYFRKNAHCAYIVIETGASDRTHMHIACCMKRKMTGDNLINTLWKYKVEPHQEGSVRGICMNKHAMVDHQWYDEYLRKEDGVQVVLDTYDKGTIDQYFPSEEDQEQLMGHVLQGTTDKPVDAFYSRLEERWIAKFPDDSSWECSVKFLQDAMYVSRTERVISDNRRFNQVAWALFCYRNKRVELEYTHKQYLRDQIGEGALTYNSISGNYLSRF